MRDLNLNDAKAFLNLRGVDFEGGGSERAASDFPWLETSAASGL